MKTILLTGAGGAPIPGLIKHLKSQGYRVIAADMDPYAAGLYCAESSYVIPPGTSPNFLISIRQICLKEKVDVLISCVDEELIAALELEKDGVIVLSPRREFIEICLDKYRTIQALESVNIPSPKTRLATVDPMNIRYPVIIKPRVGRGSRGVAIIYNEEEMISYLKSSSYKQENLLVQSYIEGTEFTVSVIVWRDGVVRAVVPKEIILKKGITRLAVTRFNTKIDLLCRRIQNDLRADGPFNVQLCIDKDTGEPLPFEINPRFSTTLSLTIASGADEIGGLVACALGEGWNVRFDNWKEGIVLVRQTFDEFRDEHTFRNHPINRIWM